MHALVGADSAVRHKLRRSLYSSKQLLPVGMSQPSSVNSASRVPIISVEEPEDDDPPAVMLWYVECSDTYTYSVSILPDGSVAAIAGIRHIEVVSGRTGAKLRTIRHIHSRPIDLPAMPNCMRLLSQSTLLVGGEQHLSVYDIEQDAESLCLPTQAPIHAVAATPHSLLAAAGHRCLMLGKTMPHYSWHEQPSFETAAYLLCDRRTALRCVRQVMGLTR